MLSNELSCPIWGGVDDKLIGEVMIKGGVLCGSWRAGGFYCLERSGVEPLKSPTLIDHIRANLSYWIYRHNFCNQLFDRWPKEEELIVLNRVWVLDHWDQRPPASDPALMFLCELIRCADARVTPTNQDSLMAASGCLDGNELAKLWQHVVEQGWITQLGVGGSPVYSVTDSGRNYVSERLREA